MTCWKLFGGGILYSCSCPSRSFDNVPINLLSSSKTIVIFHSATLRTRNLRIGVQVCFRLQATFYYERCRASLKKYRQQSARLRVKGIDALWSQAYSLLQACIIASLSLPNPISPPDTQGYLLITNPPKVWLLGNPICVPFNSFPITYWKFSLNQHILQINWFFKNHWSSPILQNGDLIQYKNPTATNS